MSTKTGRDFVRAIWDNDIDEVKRLAPNYDVNYQDWDFYTALHSACSRNYNELVKVLLSYGADPNLQTGIGQSPLHIAVENRNEELVKILLDAGVDVNLKSISGKTAMDYATNMGWKIDF